MKKQFRIILTMAAVMAGLSAAAAPKAELFKPYKSTDLRQPAVPIVLNDPYFSVWSAYDRLNDGGTTHWTGAAKTLIGMLRVDGKAYQFMGNNEVQRFQRILAVAKDQRYKGRFTNKVTGDDWMQPDYNDKAWAEAPGGWGNASNSSRISTHWSGAGEQQEIFVRRHCNVTAEQLEGDFFLEYSHNGICRLYINGHLVHDTGAANKKDQKLSLTPAMKALLHEGDNLIAACCKRTSGGCLLDYGLYAVSTIKTESVAKAEQRSVDVLATSTYFTFACGPVELDIVFTAPMLMDDLELLSTPINYISYQVRATDGSEHDVQLLLASTSDMCVNNVRNATQPCRSQVIEHKGVRYAMSGTIEQPILATKGDGVCIDWGYQYLSGRGGEVGVAPLGKTVSTFAKSGQLAQSVGAVVERSALELTALGYRHDFGRVGSKAKADYAMIGYDEIYDIEYMYRRYKALWAREGKMSIFDAFARLDKGYGRIMQACRAWDKTIYDDGLKAGDKKYAELLSGTYRLVIAAHKLFRDKDGKLLFFSKENNSNGSVNTVDLTYPECPLFLAYNPELQKAQMTSIFDYSASGRWQRDFAAHDLGTYPIANGQTYPGDMPLEESANMLTLTAQICMIEGNTKYADPYWAQLKQWNQYLVDNGQDPANQLCTDDFAGHWAHNCNLSAKAIMGILAYSKLARMKGLVAEADKYEAKARQMAEKWERDAREGDHYRLAYDRKDTWSQKYNMVWDRLWQTDLFPNGAIDREIKYYLGKQNKYGLPLDCRRDYTKGDWILWTSAMAADKADMLALIAPVYTYTNETVSRVPVSDWYDTKTSRYEAFIARSVLGGYWMPVLMQKLHSK